MERPSWTRLTFARAKKCVADWQANPRQIKVGDPVWCLHTDGWYRGTVHHAQASQYPGIDQTDANWFWWVLVDWGSKTGQLHGAPNCVTWVREN